MIELDVAKKWYKEVRKDIAEYNVRDVENNYSIELSAIAMAVSTAITNGNASAQIDNVYPTETAIILKEYIEGMGYAVALMNTSPDNYVMLIEGWADEYR